MSSDNSSGNANFNPRYCLPRPASTSPRTSTFPAPKDGTTGNAGCRLHGGLARASSPAGYVTIGSVRYGVRFAPTTTTTTTNTPAPSEREEVPPRGDAANNSRQHQNRNDGECCCGVVQFPWRSISSSRIPLPSEAMNRRVGIFSRINSGELARGPASGSTLQHEDGGVRRMQPRRRILVRPKPDIPAYLKLCSSPSPDSEACHLITPTCSRDNLADEGNSRNTLDRLHRFRLGGGGGEHGVESKGKKKATSRSSDKAERLRELTERLKSGGSSSRAAE
ncbi:uncharacterized protein LOC110830695 [Zootermopsis nevadensis]|uniref:uncharacterized protein LOC110830695 n=1 Tax=Zootermopsis nevadensis TaxID=136037 RepID=UPI000B8E4812|nr:uncharacterized protein LOC110830695 [Zootermopsis nevadensis]